MNSTMASTPTKRVRRTQKELNRNHVCQFVGCQKKYSLRRALEIHCKGKHNMTLQEIEYRVDKQRRIRKMNNTNSYTKISSESVTQNLLNNSYFSEIDSTPISPLQIALSRSTPVSPTIPLEIPVSFPISNSVPASPVAEFLVPSYPIINSNSGIPDYNMNLYCSMSNNMIVMPNSTRQNNFDNQTNFLNEMCSAAFLDSAY
eukprot:Pgem_evm1s6613